MLHVLEDLQCCLALLALLASTDQGSVSDGVWLDALAPHVPKDCNAPPWFLTLLASTDKDRIGDDSGRSFFNALFLVV